MHYGAINRGSNGKGLGVLILALAKSVWFGFRT